MTLGDISQASSNIRACRGKGSINMKENKSECTINYYNKETDHLISTPTNAHI